MKKNDSVTVKIEDYTKEGLGIGRAEGLALFVKDTVIGDVAEVRVMKMKKSYGYARLLRILEPSPDRVEAACPLARPCGGCQLQEMSASSQLRFKEQELRNDLQRIGGFEDPPMEPILAGPQFRYRNKAQYPIGRDKSGETVAGFYAGRTHAIIPCRDCLLGAEINEAILGIVLSHMEKYAIEPYDEGSGTGLVRHVMTRVSRELLGADKGPDGRKGQIMVCIVINGTSLPASEELIESLRKIPAMASISLNVNCTRGNVILGKEIHTLWGSDYIEDTIGGIRFRISPLSFYQVNPFQTEKLYGKVLEYAGLGGKENVWDLYCGIGTISLFLAGSAKRVCGIELVPEAVRDARENAALNGIENTEFIAGKAEEILPKRYREEGISADVIVLDPPRKGCAQAVLDTILLIRPKRIVYVSCDTATLSRDLKILCGGGYSLKKVCPVDMFGNSVHVETVALLTAF